MQRKPPKTIYIFLTFFFHLASLSSSTNANTPFRTEYNGHIQYKDGNRNQLAKMHMVNDNIGTYIVFVTIYFGGFNSHEYITFIYDGVSLEHEIIKLERFKEQFVFYLEKSDVDPDLIQGEVFSKNEGTIGSVFFQKKNSNTKSTPLPSSIIPPLEGQYWSQCRGKKNVIYIETIRSGLNQNYRGDPFSYYQIVGQWGQKNGKICSKGKYCVINQFEGGSYQFLHGHLNLIGDQFVISCDMKDINVLNCDGCDFKRKVENNSIGYIQNHPSSQIKKLHEVSSLNTKKTPSLAKKFVGFLYHENLAIFQEIQIIFSRNSDDANSFAAIVKLFFGDKNSDEYLVYEFFELHKQKTNYSLLLQNLEGDVDAVLLIEKEDNFIVSGQWYSLIYGNVGPFVMYAEEDLEVWNQAREIVGDDLVKPTSGQYHSDVFYWDLNVYQFLSPPISRNPFYPMEITGFITFTGKVSPTLSLRSGQYDFYTGKIGLRETSRTMTGFLGKDGMHMRYKAQGFSTIMQPYKLKFYRRKNQREKPTLNQQLQEVRR